MLSQARRRRSGLLRRPPVPRASSPFPQLLVGALPLPVSLRRSPAARQFSHDLEAFAACPSVLRPSVSRSAEAVASLGLLRSVVSSASGSADPSARSPAPCARSPHRPQAERYPCAPVHMQLFRTLSGSDPFLRQSTVPRGVGQLPIESKHPPLRAGALFLLRQNDSPLRARRSSLSTKAFAPKGAHRLAEWARQRVFHQLPLGSWRA